MKVLLLSDRTPDQLADVTRKDNVTTVRVADLSEALASLEKSHFDIVVLSGLNGHTEDTCSQIKKASRIPVVAMVNPEQARWNEINWLNADGLVSEEMAQELLLDRLRVLVIRSRAAKKAGLSSLSLRDLVLPGRSNPSRSATGNVGRLPLRKRGIKVASPAAVAPNSLNSSRVAAHVRPQFSINWRSLANRKTLMQVMYGALAAVIGLLLFIALVPGYSLLLVRSQSMEPAINMGDMIVTGPVNGPLGGNMAVGKVITYASTERNGQLVSHRVIAIVDGDTLTTKGDASEAADPPVKMSLVRGMYIFKIPYVGYIQSFVHSKTGWFLSIIIPSMVLVGFIIKDILKEAFNEKK